MTQLNHYIPIRTQFNYRFLISLRHLAILDLKPRIVVNRQYIPFLHTPNHSVQLYVVNRNKF